MKTQEGDDKPRFCTKTTLLNAPGAAISYKKGKGVPVRQKVRGPEAPVQRHQAVGSKAKAHSISGKDTHPPEGLLSWNFQGLLDKEGGKSKSWNGSPGLRGSNLAGGTF